MSNTYYTESDLQVLLSKSPIINREQEAIYDLSAYRLAAVLYYAAVAGRPDYQDIDPVTGVAKTYSKADTLALAERYSRSIYKVAVNLYNSTPTVGAIRSAIQAEGGWPWLTAEYLARAVFELWTSIPTEMGSQVLADASAFGANWAVANGFSIAGGKLVYANNAGANTATQIVGGFLVAGDASKWYKLDYTISDVTVVTGVLTLTGFSAVPTILSIVAGKRTTFFLSAATLPGAGNFVLTATSTAGGFKIDELQLIEYTPAFLATTDLAGNIIGNSVVMTLEGKQRIAYQLENAIRELRYSELATYGPNPVL